MVGKMELRMAAAKVHAKVSRSADLLAETTVYRQVGAKAVTMVGH